MQGKWQLSHWKKKCSKCSLSGERFVQEQYVPELKGVWLHRNWLLYLWRGKGLFGCRRFVCQSSTVDLVGKEHKGTATGTTKLLFVVYNPVDHVYDHIQSVRRFGFVQSPFLHSFLSSIYWIEEEIQEWPA
jgi:hypothetical protein